MYLRHTGTIAGVQATINTAIAIASSIGLWCIMLSLNASGLLHSNCCDGCWPQGTIAWGRNSQRHVMCMVEFESYNVRTSSVPSVKRTLRWIWHSRSFKVILIGAGRNPYPSLIRRPRSLCSLWNFSVKWIVRKLPTQKMNDHRTFGERSCLIDRDRPMIVWRSSGDRSYGYGKRSCVNVLWTFIVQATPRIGL